MIDYTLHAHQITTALKAAKSRLLLFGFILKK